MTEPCGKRTYASRHKARAATAAAGWRFRDYYCRSCRGWHVTNEDKSHVRGNERVARREPRRERELVPQEALMAHECHALGCTKNVPPKLLMCPPHWRKVTPDIQRAVWATYRPGQEVDKRPSREYLVVQKIAVATVAAKEKVPGWQACVIEAALYAHEYDGRFEKELRKIANRLKQEALGVAALEQVKLFEAVPAITEWF